MRQDTSTSQKAVGRILSMTCLTVGHLQVVEDALKQVLVWVLILFVTELEPCPLAACLELHEQEGSVLALCL